MSDTDTVQQQVAQEANEEANIDVGNFLSELYTVCTVRSQTGLREGEYLSEVAHAYTDLRCFGRDHSIEQEGKLQITLTLDASTSMWNTGVMRWAGPVFCKMDRVIRKACKELPVDTLHYQPFVFHGSAFPLPAAFVPAYNDAYRGNGLNGRYMIRNPTPKMMENAKLAREIPHNARPQDYLMYEGMTSFAAAFKSIRAWEKRFSDQTAMALDLILTDAICEYPEDKTEATKIQRDRSGQSRCVFLNFMPQSEYEYNLRFNPEYGKLPTNCKQYFLNDPKKLTQTIRRALTSAIQELYNNMY